MKAPIHSEIVKNAIRAITPLNHDYWFEKLPQVLNDDSAAKVCSYIDYGVPIFYEGDIITVESPNWPSANLYSEQVTEVVNRDVSMHRLLGPFKKPPFENYKISPLGAFERKNSGKVRIIHDLSFPPTNSVNDGIEKENCTLAYISIDDAVEICRSQNNHVYMSKIDLKEAFKFVPCEPRSWPLLGFSWQDSKGQNQYYFSQVLPFGMRSSPKVFDIIADALQKIMIYNGASVYTLRYMDDFITISTDYDSTLASLNVILDTCRRAGFEVQPSKVTLPSKVIEFLGIEIDVNVGQLRITEERLKEIKNELSEWDSRKKCTKRQLLSIIGKLMFVSRVVRTGRAFVGRLIELSKKTKYLHYFIYLNKEARGDLRWWQKCIASHNGVRMFDLDWTSSMTLHLWSDASDVAAAATYGDEWFYVTYSGSASWMLQMTICWRELYALVKAICTWGHNLQNKQLCLHVDNMGVVYSVNKLYSRSPPIMSLIRSLCLLVELYHIDIYAEYISTTDNVAADALSRLNMDSFRAVRPTANKYMTWPSQFDYDGNLI